MQEDQWGLCALHQGPRGSRQDVRVGRGGGGERAGSQDWGREEGGRCSVSQALPVSRGLQARAVAAGMPERCWDPPRTQHLTNRRLRVLSQKGL